MLLFWNIAEPRVYPDKRVWTDLAVKRWKVGAGLYRVVVKTCQNIFQFLARPSPDSWESTEGSIRFEGDSRILMDGVWMVSGCVWNQCTVHTRSTPKLQTTDLWGMGNPLLERSASQSLSSPYIHVPFLIYFVILSGFLNRSTSWSTRCASKSWVKFCRPAQRSIVAARRSNSESRAVSWLKRPQMFSCHVETTNLRYPWESDGISAHLFTGFVMSLWEFGIQERRMCQLVCTSHIRGSPRIRSHHRWKRPVVWRLCGFWTNGRKHESGVCPAKQRRKVVIGGGRAIVEFHSFTS